MAADQLPWFRADSNSQAHDKFIDLAGLGAKGKSAGFVYWMSLSYSAGQGTGGVIKRGALPFIHGTPADARILVEARLWEATDTGWKIKNYGTRNVVGMMQQSIADSMRAAQAEGGKKGAERRWGSDG